MDFKFNSKTTLGAISTLTLVIILSQSRFFNFLIDTALGRAALICLIMGISYTHKILGVVAVLFVIIMFNQSYLGSSEGFTSQPATKDATTKDATTTDAATTDATTKDATTTHTTKDADKMPADDAAHDKKQKSSAVTTTISSAVSTPTPTHTTSTGETFVGGREGFNITEREGTLLRGKRSNEVPVFSNARSQSDDVEPADKSVLSGGLFSSA
jgi:FtsZ-interacting cell division protein ZipA